MARSSKSPRAVPAGPLTSLPMRSARSTATRPPRDRKSTRRNSSHGYSSYAVDSSHARPPQCQLFPYTTLFRSWKRWLTDNGVRVNGPLDRHYFESIYFNDPDGTILEIATRGPGWAIDEPPDALGQEHRDPPAARSEEHTSELQSRLQLVCRRLIARATPAVPAVSLHDALPVLEAMAARQRCACERPARPPLLRIDLLQRPGWHDPRNRHARSRLGH